MGVDAFIIGSQNGKKGSPKVKGGDEDCQNFTR